MAQNPSPVKPPAPQVAQVISSDDSSEDVQMSMQPPPGFVKPPQQPAEPVSKNFTEGLELEQPPFFKLKSMSLLKLVPGKGWAKVAGVNLYLAKCVQLKDQSVFIIGGSNDQKSVETINRVT